MSSNLLASSAGKLITASTLVPSLNTWEGFNLKTDVTKKGQAVLITGSVTTQKLLDLSNLKWCSEAYDISPDPKDYIFTEIPANNVGLPNRNMDCFSMDDVTEWRPQLGRVAFETYRWKTCNQDHDNKEPLRAKGAIFGSSLVKIKGKYHVKVIAGWCRQKDPHLTNRILNRKDAGYSMACFVGEARCSYCGFPSTGGGVTCEHIRGGSGKGTLFTPNDARNPVLLFEYCGKLNYHEISHVEDRADYDCIAHWIN